MRWPPTASTAADNPHRRFDGLANLCDRILADVAGPADWEDDLCLLAIQAPRSSRSRADG